MRPTRSAPIGKTWTRVLRLVHDKQLITTEGIAAELYRPADDPRPRAGWPTPATDPAGRLVASDAARRVVRLMLARMAKQGYLARARPWPPGELWKVGEAGVAVLDEMARPRAYKSPRYLRKRAKARRDAAREQDRCVNENARGTHGPAIHGVRCFACHETHRRSR